MNKEMIKKQQPIFYRMIENALQKENVSHAYLLCGSNAKQRMACANLLIKSLLCENVDSNHIACEKCNICQKVEQKTYYDYAYIDGSKETIKKEQILQLQSFFVPTALEKSNRKVYVINQVENATLEAMNTMLKFLEEPQGKITAILMSDQVEKVLPTILSRCQIITLKNESKKDCLNTLQNKYEYFDAFMLVHLQNVQEEFEDILESEEYQHALFIFKEFIKAYKKSAYEALYILLHDGMEASSSIMQKQWFYYFLTFLQVFYKECIFLTYEKEDWMKEMIQTSNDGIDIYCKWIEIILHIKDQLHRSTALPLLCDELIYQMQEVKK